jgi:biotin carboxylase
MTILCISSYEKGQDFLRECAESGARTILITVEKLRDAAWPRDILDGFHLLPSFDVPDHVVNAVSYLARSERIDRIVALDEFDMELAALLREHLRIPGLGVTTTRGVRDKLAMRELARDAGLQVPEFAGIVNHADIAEYVARVPGPWVLKPRTQASAIGIRKLHEAGELWPILESLGDMQSHHLLERYIPGDVYHVDGIVHGGAIQFAEVHRYAQPPFDVMHAGGIFCSRTVERGGEEERALRSEVARLADAVALRDGVFHAEFIRARETGVFHFLEIAARVGGAHIADMVVAATGVNLWREWARLELALASGERYTPPPRHRDHAGVLISLARQERPDTSAYDDPEIVWRLVRHHHAGLVVRSPDVQRVEQLLDDYMRRFGDDFHAALPAPERATN